METADLARLIADKITSIANGKGVSINKMLSNAGLSKSVVDRMKLGTMPSSEKLAAIAAELDVPMEYLMGSGVFSKWDLILEHKHTILSSIADMMGDLAAAIRGGVDDLTLAKLVCAFRVDIDMDVDPTGVEILVVSPVPAYGPEQAPPLSDNSSNTGSQEMKKAPAPEISENGRRMLGFFEELPTEQQRELIGEAHAYHRMLAKEKGASSSEKAV